MNLQILGIRHHGVGSAKYVVEALESIQPDLILVEGAPELDSVTEWVSHKEMKPPVSVLAYNLEDPSQAVFYPFTTFSPEWQAIQYALKKKLKVQMLDLPLAHSFALEKAKKEEQQRLLEEYLAKQNEVPEIAEKEIEKENEASLEVLAPNLPPKDPMSYLAELAGYDNSELWWENNFEQNHIKGSWKEHFAAVWEAMSALREHIDSPDEDRTLLREAYMRKIIREAEKNGFTNVVVICGAWHAPTLSSYNSKVKIKEDEALLKSLPKVEVSATWIPWTNTRLSMFSGYGAGIVSPGWYEHLWKHPQDKGSRWLSKVAKLFREKEMDTSTAHVIEAYRLSEALAALRNLSRPGLQELNEATQTVICFGDKILLKLVEEELIVAKTMGKVPQKLPKLPIQNDFEKEAKNKRLPIEDIENNHELDLRKPLDLQRSIFFHRLQILGISWAKKAHANSKGTFKEVWNTRWKPEMMIDLIEKGFWGNSIEAASSAFLLDNATNTQDISLLAEMVEVKALPAELFEAVKLILDKIIQISAVAADVIDLMGALKHLVNTLRYGNVRKTDTSIISSIVDSFIRRICVGLPNAAYGLDQKNSYNLFQEIKNTNDAVRLIQVDELSKIWHQCLRVILHKEGVHEIIVGFVCRLLYDLHQISADETAQELGLALSPANKPAHSAAWLEGFLSGSGSLLLYDHTLWNILYKWVAQLEQEVFMELMPLLRRTFSYFEPDERKQIGEKAKFGLVQAETILAEKNQVLEDTLLFSEQRAFIALKPFQTLFGIKN